MDKVFDFDFKKIEYIVKREYNSGACYRIIEKKDFRFCYVIKGSADFYFENLDAVHTSKDDLILLYPGNDYYVKVSDGRRYSFITIAFSGEGNFLKDNEIIKLNHSPDLMTEYEKMLNYYNIKEPVWKFKAKSVLNLSLLSLFSKDAKIQKLKVYPAILYIRKNYMKKISLAQLASRCGYSTSYFKSVFTKETGLTPIKYLNKFRVDLAKGFLKSGMFSVGEISSMCGFENTYYFSNVFKKFVGISPMKYKNKE